MSPRSGVSADARQVPPGRRWFVAAAVFGLTFATLAAGVLVTWLIPATGTRDQEFRTGESVTVTLKPTAAIYVDINYSAGTCQVTSASGENVRISTSHSTFKTSAGGRKWRLAKRVHVQSPGEHRVSCTGDFAWYAIGEVSIPSNREDLTCGGW